MANRETSFDEKYVKVRFIGKGGTGTVYYCLPKTKLNGLVPSPDNFRALRAFLLAVKGPREDGDQYHNEIIREVHYYTELHRRIRALDQGNIKTTLDKHIFSVIDYNNTRSQGGPWFVSRTIHPALELRTLKARWEETIGDIVQLPFSFIAHLFLSLLNVVEAFRLPSIAFGHGDLVDVNIIFDLGIDEQRDHSRFPNFKIIDLVRSELDNPTLSRNDLTDICSILLHFSESGGYDLSDEQLNFVELLEKGEGGVISEKELQDSRALAYKFVSEEPELKVRYFNERLDEIAETVGVKVTDEDLQKVLKEVNAGT